MTRTISGLNIRDAVTLVAAFCLFAITAVAGSAQEITLTSRAGGLTLTGRLIGYDGDFLRIESAYGPLTVDYGDVVCAGEACPDRQDFTPLLRISGAGRIADVLLPALLEGFARETGRIAALTGVDPARIVLTDPAGDQQLEVTIRASSSAEGFADLVSFEADAALSYREPSVAERDRVTEIGLADLARPGHVAILGIDALVPIVSPANPARTIDPARLDLAFTGGWSAWPDGTPLTLHLGPESDGQAEGFLQALSGPPVAITRHRDPDALAAAVAADPGALGLASLGATGIAQPLGLQDACGLSFLPRPNGIKTQDYPLTTPVILALSQSRQPEIVREFLRYLRTPQAHLIIRRSGLIDLGVVPIPLDAQGGRLAHAIGIAGPETPLTELQRMVQLLRERARVSLTFRFERGGTALDPVSTANLLTLAHDIRAGAFAGREILLIGFSDGAGPASANLDLSAARAEGVRAQLVALLGDLPEDVRLRTEAFGEAMPMGCDDTDWGRQLNRRVEVWVGD